MKIKEGPKYLDIEMFEVPQSDFFLNWREYYFLEKQETEVTKKKTTQQLIQTLHF